MYSVHAPRHSRESMPCDTEASGKPSQQSESNGKPWGLFPDWGVGNAVLLTKPLRQTRVGKVQ